LGPDGKPKAEEGYLFGGWTPAVGAAVTGESIYTALWTVKTVRVEFYKAAGDAKAAGGAKAVGRAKAADGAVPDAVREYDYYTPSVPIGDVPSFSVPGSAFLGWDTDAVQADAVVAPWYFGDGTNGGSGYTGGSPGKLELPFVATTADRKGYILKLYGKWETIDYVIGYELGGGVNHAGNPAGYTTAALNRTAITLGNPTRSGYTFDGWTGGNGSAVDIRSATKQPSFGGASGRQDITGNMVFTAHWSAVGEPGGGGSGSGGGGWDSGGGSGSGSGDGSGSGGGNGTGGPDTGDEANPALPAIAMAISAALLLVLALKQAQARRTRRREKGQEWK
jgi:uncharacterized repeat protein (TIGR02543 family)